MASLFFSTEQLLEDGIKLFLEEYRCSPETAGIAPGRVNLIGEHTDYNEGFVFPMALPNVTIVVGKKNNSNFCCILTSNENVDKHRKVKFSLPSEENPLVPGDPKWANYVKGVVQYFEGPRMGFDAVIVSNVPFGGGLSSSAALEVATYSFLESLSGHKTDLKQKALLCQKAEHVFASVPCGLMDQLIAIYGKEQCAALIDCRSLDVKNIVVPTMNCVFLIINSNVHHNLASSEYAKRRKTCEETAQKLKKKSLRDVTLDEINELHLNRSIDDITCRRVRHVITENERTLGAAKALENNNLLEFGSLMYQSHDSLSKDYEVSCEELDFLVETVRKMKGVYGSRMTGGGFGGCTVTLVEKTVVNDVIKKVQELYVKKANFFVVIPSSGTYTVCLDDR